MTKDKLKGFFTGVLVTTMFMVFVASAFASNGSREITATYNNIKIYVDGTLITPRDASGNVVEPFISGGTTYLPVRAVGEALGKPVDWDGPTNSVYIGDRPSDAATTPDPAPTTDTSNTSKQQQFKNLRFSYDPKFELVEKQDEVEIKFDGIASLTFTASPVYPQEADLGLKEYFRGFAAGVTESLGIPVTIADTTPNAMGVSVYSATGSGSIDGHAIEMAFLGFCDREYIYIIAFMYLNDESSPDYTGYYLEIMDSVEIL